MVADGDDDVDMVDPALTPATVNAQSDPVVVVAVNDHARPRRGATRFDRVR